MMLSKVASRYERRQPGRMKSMVMPHPRTTALFEGQGPAKPVDTIDTFLLLVNERKDIFL